MTFSKDAECVCVTEWNEGLYREALSWVDEGRRVFLLSDRERESEDPRISVCVLESPLQVGMLARKIAWASVFKKLEVVGNGAFAKELKDCHLAAHAILSEAADYWTCPMRNARVNEAPYRRGMDLEGAFERVPAIIVGAGPSLEQNLPFLRLFQDRALVFAAGSALNILEEEPHFAASIDAKAPYHSFKMSSFPEVPFCYQSRMNRENFSLLHGEKILFPDSSCEAINWIHGEESMDGGWTVGNFLTSIALHMGCSPIFFMGMDFCYERGRKYAKMETGPTDSLVQVGDVWTQRDWLMAARWIEEKASGSKMFDLSRGILHLPKITTNEALWLCSRSWDLKLKVHEAIQKLPLKKALRWPEWDASLKRCLENKELDEEIVYQKLLSPLWRIWGPIFEREGQNLELHRKLFFQKVLEEHEELVLRER